MERSFKRRNYFIDKKFQTKFIIKFSFIVILTSLLICFLFIFLSRDSTTVTIENAKVVVKSTSDFIFPIIIQTLIIVTAFSAFSVIILTLFTSHRIAGPLFRIKREIELLKDGNLNLNFRIRKNDQLQDLASSLSSLAETLRNKHNDFKKNILEIKNILVTSYNDKSALEAKVKELEDKLNYFKI
jgi:methyl-accepting chemotaxis protein